jgi:hypothetical protein
MHILKLLSLKVAIERQEIDLHKIKQKIDFDQATFNLRSKTISEKIDEYNQLKAEFNQTHPDLVKDLPNFELPIYKR